MADRRSMTRADDLVALMLTRVGFSHRQVGRLIKRDHKSIIGAVARAEANDYPEEPRVVVQEALETIKAAVGAPREPTSQERTQAAQVVAFSEWLRTGIERGWTHVLLQSVGGGR